nr:hypothetical protein K-LCC10_0427 [Kaumoebavirus]
MGKEAKMNDDIDVRRVDRKDRKKRNEALKTLNHEFR